jgi:glycosyltransferase involved in cell wall biosynthesis
MVATRTPFAGLDSEGLSATPVEVSRARPTVLHFIYGLGGGGAESMMRSLMQGLDRRRWRVVVVALQAEAWPEETEDLRRTVDALHVLEERALLSAGTLKKLRAVIRAERPDVVQTWMHHADFTGGLVARFAGVKQVVWGIHCREITRAAGESRIKSGLFERVMPLMAQWVPSRIVSCSQAALEDHVKLGYPKEKMIWIPNGVDTQRFRPLLSAREDMRARLGLASDAFVIGYAGRAHEMKNLPLLLRAFGLLHSKEGSVRLVLCGVVYEELDAASRAIVKALPDQAAVSWLPFQGDPEHFYPALDVFTLSSRTEACPMTLLEAMACGVPCVTTDVGDCSQLIGDTGSVVAAGDAEALVTAWLAAMESPAQERLAQSVAARDRVKSTFSLERAAAGYQDVYETLIQHPPS